MKKQRLLILIWHLGIGGMQKRMRDVVLEMEKKYPHWEIIFLVKQKKQSFIAEQLTKSNNVKIEYFSESHYWSNSIFSFMWLAGRWWYWRPDVCLTFLDHLSVSAVCFKKLFFWRKCRVVLNESMFTSIYVLMQRGKMAFLWKFLIRRTYGWADKIVVPTIAGKNDLVDNYLIPEKIIKVVSNWTMFKRGSSKSDLYDVIYVGRIDREKGIDVLIEVAGELKKTIPAIHIAVVGDGKSMGWLFKRIEELKLTDNIKIFGYHDNVRPMLMHSKVLLLPTKNEGMPNVVLEAGICGVPTISSNFMGVEEIIHDEISGFVAISQNEMVEKCLLLLTNNKLREKIGNRMKADVLAHFSSAKQKEFILQLTNE